jgi:putative tricarboxylic transport membrane protein
MATPGEEHTMERLLGAATAAMMGVLLVLAAGPARAIDDLKVMAPASPGGGYDRTARAVQQALEQAGLARGVTVSNVPGAAGAIGLAQFIRSYRGDGSSMIVGGFGMVASFLTNKSAVTLDDVTPIARLTGEVSLVVVPAASPIRSLNDLVAKLKADPGGVAWAGGSAGGTDHIVAGMIAKAVGVDPRKVNYVAFSGGGDSLAALVGNQVAAGVGGYSELIEQVKAGTLRTLALTAEARVPGVDIPTLKEQGVDVTLVNWRGIAAPPGISGAQRQAYLDMIDRMARSEAWKAQLAKNGWTDAYLAGDRFARYIEAERDRIAAVLKDLGLLS